MRSEVVHIIKMKELEDLIENKYNKRYLISYYEEKRFFPNVQARDKICLPQHTKRVRNFCIGIDTNNLLPNLLSELVADQTLPGGSYLII